MYQITINTYNEERHVDRVLGAIAGETTVSTKLVSKGPKFVIKSEDLQAIMRVKLALGMSDIPDFPCVVFWGIKD
jgi:hypothetical protein